WDGQQRLHVVTGLFDLTELAFQTQTIGLGCGQFVVQVLQLIFHHPATRSPGTGARAGLGTSGDRSATKLQRVRSFRLVFGNGRLTFLEVRLEAFFFLEKVTKGLLAKRRAPLN